MPKPSPISRRKFIARGTAASAALGAGLHVARLGRAAEEQKWGDLTGRFVYDGSAPERKRLIVDKDVDCCGKFDIRDESLMVAEDGGLANVYVYLRTRRVDVWPELEENCSAQVLLDNLDCIFQPHCLTIWRQKQELLIVNSDPVSQNVAFSPFGDRSANIILPPPPAEAAKATWEFARRQSEPVPIKCNYHPWESAYILPTDNPYAAISKSDGSFSIPNLPVGTLEFQVWQERLRYLQTPEWKRGRVTLTIQPGTNDLGTIRLSPALWK